MLEKMLHGRGEFKKMKNAKNILTLEDARLTTREMP